MKIKNTIDSNILREKFKSNLDTIIEKCKEKGINLYKIK